MESVLIQHAQLFNQQGTVDCLIRNGKIDRLEANIQRDLVTGAYRVLDASGLILMPGVIDIHVHFRVPGGEYKEDFVSGSAAALAGGVTTAFHMPNTSPPIVTAKLLQKVTDQAKEESAIDLRCYIGATTDNLKEILKSTEIACGVKIAPYFTGKRRKRLIDDEEALEKLFATEQPLVIVVHCEDERTVDENAKQLKHYTGIDIHSKIRSRETAISALKRVVAITKKTKAKVHITHVSTKEELELVREAKDDGCDMTCDVTPHHLAFSLADNEQFGHMLKVNPPVREEEDISALWSGIKNGDIDIVASDHAPHLLLEKQNEDYWKVPSGLPGVETMLPFLLDKISDDFTLERVVELVAKNPAQRFGLSGKGAIEVGADADLLLIDLNEKTVINQDKLKTKCEWSPWEGSIFNGKIQHCIMHGAVKY